MRIISFCAEGIENAAQEGFYDWVLAQDADIICVQDLRAQEYDLQDNVYFPDGYFPYFFDSPDSVNGVAIYVRQMPKAIMTGLGFGELDIEARYIQADFEHISVGCLLAPMAEKGKPEELEQKEHFYKLLQNHLNKIRNKRREYVLCGNWFMAHREADVQDAKACADMPGFLPEEREWLEVLFRDLGYVDGFRRVNSDDDEFSWWPDGDRSKGGMRTDMQILSNGLRNSVEYGVINKVKTFSNHAPVIMDYDIEIR
jgi:exodeoxyribonuclease-3